MRYLLINLLIVLMGCTSYPKHEKFISVLEPESSKNATVNSYFSNSDIDYIYRANITVYDNAFGGIFIVKKIAKNEHRVVFTTEMGNKIFDFTYFENDFKVNFVIDKLDNRILLNVLKRDFKVLITEKEPIVNTYLIERKLVKKVFVLNKEHYYYYYKNNQLKKVVRVKKKKEKVIFLFSKIKEDIAGNIEVKHNNIKLLIKLRRI